MQSVARVSRWPIPKDYSWQDLGAACKGLDPEIFYSQAREAEAKEICADCEVRARCLAFALKNREEFGIWGGMTERERNALRRHNPSQLRWLTPKQKSTYEGALKVLQGR